MERIGRVVFTKNENKDDKVLYIKKGKFNNIYEEGYAGYLFEEEVLSDDILSRFFNGNIPYAVGIRDSNVCDGDVIEFNANRKTIKVLYKVNSYENVILTTNQCNNNCIMCPDPDSIRQSRNNADIEKLKLLVSLMDKNSGFLCITGGEPAMLKEDLFELLDTCKSHLNNTEFLMLTNGRIFCYEEYTEKFINHSPNGIIIGIPVHSYKQEIHDEITRVKGSFVQTCNGIRNLLKYNQLVEIRVVINKYNYKDLPKMAQMICDEFPDCYRVNFMAMEILGNAYLNCEDVWVDFDEIKSSIEKACTILLLKGIRAYIYNMPLCYIDKKYWGLVKKSITDYKIRYSEECSNCAVKEECGGFFASTLKFKKLRGKCINE